MTLRQALNSAQAAAMSDEDVAQEAAAMLRECLEPAFVINIRSALIIASSVSASVLLDPHGADVVGHRLEEFTSDDPSGALDLFIRGQISGYEVVRTLPRPGSSDDLKVHLWYRQFDHQLAARFALVLISVDEASWAGWSTEPRSGPAAVVGIAGKSQLIERISGESLELFGDSPAALVGQPIQRLVTPADVETWLLAIAKSAETGHAVTLILHARGNAQDERGLVTPVPCDALVLPLTAIPGFSFVFLPTSGLSGQSFGARGLSALLLRLARVADFAHLERQKTVELTEPALPGLSQLTTRELDVMTRLHAGYRVTGIAADLFVSTSTVRSHLASIFAKVGVTSQEELLSAIRASRSNFGHSNRYPSVEDRQDGTSDA